jgi:hypothetical protein
MKHRISIIIAGLLLTATAQAQTWKERKPVTVDLNYNFSMPQGDFKNNFIDKNSAAGFNLDIMYWLKPTLSIGGSLGYQDYYQKYPRALYKLSDGSDISAVVSNSLQTIPIMVKSNYMPLAQKQSFIQPYFTAAAGVNLVDYSQYLGEFGASNTKARFTALAGAGIKIPFKKYSESGFLLGANYQYSPYNFNDLKSLNSINIQAGIRLRVK